MSSASRPKIPMRDVHLAFGVSLDEEYVTLHATCGSTTHDVTSRVPKYVLLMVARQRLADAAAGLPDQDCGWVEQERLPPAAGGRGLRVFPAAPVTMRVRC